MIGQAIAALLVCLALWFAVFAIMWEANPMFKNEIKQPSVWLRALAIFGFLSVVVALANSCTPYRDAQAAEPLECRDEALAVILADCLQRIKFEENVTEKYKLQVECLERVDQWEQCQ